MRFYPISKDAEKQIHLEKGLGIIGLCQFFACSGFGPLSPLPSTLW